METEPRSSAAKGWGSVDVPVVPVGPVQILSHPNSESLFIPIPSPFQELIQRIGEAIEVVNRAGGIAFHQLKSQIRLGTKVPEEMLIDPAESTIHSNYPAKLDFYRGQLAAALSFSTGQKVDLLNLKSNWGRDGDEIAVFYPLLSQELNLKGVRNSQQFEILQSLGCFSEGKSARWQMLVTLFHALVEVSVRIDFSKSCTAQEGVAQENWKPALESLQGPCELIRVENLEASSIDDPLLAYFHSVLKSSHELLRLHWKKEHFSGQNEILIRRRPSAVALYECMRTSADLKLKDFWENSTYIEHVMAQAGERELEVFQQIHPMLTAVVPKILDVVSDEGATIQAVSAFAERVRRPWTNEEFKFALKSMAGFHSIWFDQESIDGPWLKPSLSSVLRDSDFFRALADHARDTLGWFTLEDHDLHYQLIEEMPQWWSEIEVMSKTVVNHGLHPLNTTILRNADDQLSLEVSDWSWTSVHLPQRDLVELMAFHHTDQITLDEVDDDLELHRLALEEVSGVSIPSQDWLDGYRLCLKDYLVRSSLLYAVLPGYSTLIPWVKAYSVLRHLLYLEQLRHL